MRREAKDADPNKNGICQADFPRLCQIIHAGEQAKLSEQNPAGAGVGGTTSDNLITYNLPYRSSSEREITSACNSGVRLTK